MKWFNALVIFITLFTFQNSFAQMPYFCNSKIESLPIQANGRVKPLYVHANEVLKYMTEKKDQLGHSATQVFCLLSLKSMGMDVPLNLEAPIGHVQVREFLNLKEKKTSFDKLLSAASTINMEARSIKEDNSYKKALNKLLQKISLYQSIISGQSWSLPEVNNNEVKWVSFSEFMTEEKVKYAQAQGADPFAAIFAKANNDYVKAKGDKHLFEYKYAKAKLPIWALTLTLLALATLVLFRKFNAVLLFAFATVVVQIVYVACRVYISGRAPITNMYETVMFSGLGSLMLALVIGHYRNEKLFVYVGLGYNTCTLLMTNFAGGMLSNSIGPLVPVLRDNFWLSTHVTTVILSYGAYALSWILANSVLLRGSFFSISKSDEKYYCDLIYTCLKYASILLAAGIILGGVWADYSWGRFWGWDPKETWSLIVLCIYMSILHGRYTSWIKNTTFIPLVAGAFMSVMMAWFGVNYILASGLHSYGFSEGGAIFLGSFFFCQSALLVIVKMKGLNYEEDDSAKKAALAAQHN